MAGKRLVSSDVVLRLSGQEDGRGDHAKETL
jgi:hypothetical protein